MACYIGLLRFAEGKASELEGRSFHLSAIAGAMFLVLSIAGADLLVAVGLLCSHREEPKNWRWRMRKVFGSIMLLNFGLLVADSVLVLFHASVENIDLIVGAAAVLFIADVVS